MNSKVLMIVALLFAGSVVASPEGHENITLGMKPSFGWFTFKGPQESAQSSFDFTSHFKKEEFKPTRFARLKEVVVNNPYKTTAAVVAVAVVASAIYAYAKSAQEVVVEAEEENYFA